MLKLFAMKAAEGYIQKKYKARPPAPFPAFRVSLILTFHNEHLHRLTLSILKLLHAFTSV